MFPAGQRRDALIKMYNSFFLFDYVDKGFESTVSLLRVLVSGQYITPSRIDVDNPVVPVMTARGHDIMAKLDQRFVELKVLCPRDCSMRRAASVSLILQQVYGG